jgi:hypothetical protein
MLSNATFRICAKDFKGCFEACFIEQENFNVQVSCLGGSQAEDFDLKL